MCTADDYRDANGVDVLDFFQAQDKARDLANEHAGANRSNAPLSAVTVKLSCEEYVENVKAEKNEAASIDAKQRLDKHVIPTLGHRAVSELTLTELKRWRNKLVTRKSDPVSKATANRIWANFQAALNLVFQDEKRGIRSDKAWRAVRPLKNAQSARQDHFQAKDVQTLIDESRKVEPPFADLLVAGFLTGARLGELTACDVSHFDARGGVLNVPSGKTGARSCTLLPDAIEFFKALVKGRPSDAPLLPNGDGARWGKSEQHRRIKRDLKAAKLPTTASFYSLRHSHVSRMIEADVSTFLIAENLGTSEKMIASNYAHLLAKKRSGMLKRAAGAFKLTVIPGGKENAA
jgi:integrase